MNTGNPDNESPSLNAQGSHLFPGHARFFARVTQRIEPGKKGRVEWNQTLWRAVLSNEDEAAGVGVEEGAYVQTIGRQGNTLVVSSHAGKALSLSIEAQECTSPDKVATELATLCKALNAYHIACGGNGLTIDDWETLIAIRELVGV